MNAAIYPLSSRQDNYIWIIRKGRQIVVVDPGESAPVLEHLQQHDLTLHAVLITHHHGDHTDGIRKLLEHSEVPVYGPAAESIAGVSRGLAEGDVVALPELDLRFTVMEVPGHTAGHIAYYADEAGGAPALFGGDTLFSCSCGRLFEGSAAQMQNNLAKFRKLPENTRVFAAHEYTVSNIEWALNVDPDNAALQAWQQEAADLRQAGKPTLPTTLAQEKSFNPFMRTDDPVIRERAQAYAGRELSKPEAVLEVLRDWKNNT